MVELLRTFGMCGVYQRAGGIWVEREGFFIETTSLVTSKTILINGVDVYEKYTKQMLIQDFKCRITKLYETQVKNTTY